MKIKNYLNLKNIKRRYRKCQQNFLTQKEKPKKQRGNSKNIPQQKIIDGQFKGTPLLELERENKSIIFSGLIAFCSMNFINSHFLKN